LAALLRRSARDDRRAELLLGNWDEAMLGKLPAQKKAPERISGA
jgi:hypothetical protein